jgi:signal transduction protein with GAF and PtsI domain
MQMTKQISLLERAKLQEEYEYAIQRAEALRSLHKVGALVASPLDSEEILTRVVEAAISIIKVEEGILFLGDQYTNELYVRAQKGLGEKQAQTLKLKINDTLIGSVFKTGEAIRLNKKTRLASGHIN